MLAGERPLIVTPITKDIIGAPPLLPTRKTITITRVNVQSMCFSFFNDLWNAVVCFQTPQFTYWKG